MTDQNTRAPVVSSKAGERCPICDWPFAESREKGCVPGDCSYRPDESAEQERIRRRDALAASRDTGSPAECLAEFQNWLNTRAPSRAEQAELRQKIARIICCPDGCMQEYNPDWSGKGCYTSRDTYKFSNVGKSTELIMAALASHFRSLAQTGGK